MTETPGIWPPTIPEAARRAAETWPDRPALIVGDQSWTFARLWADARATASAMLAAGLRHGDRVGIWAPNTRELILAALGAQSVGAAIVPMNTRFKGGEAGDILRRSHAKLLFAPAHFLGQDYAALIAGEDLPDLREVIAIDRDFDAFVARGRGSDDPAADAGVIGHPANPAYGAAKRGVVGLVKSCVTAFAERGARINAICPGGVMTPLIGAPDVAIVAPDDLERVALRGMGSAQHVAEVALWLASPAAGFVNGQAQVVDAALLSTFAPILLPVGP